MVTRDEAVAGWRKVVSHGMSDAQPHFLREIEQTMSLVAFQNPSESPLGHLLEQSQRCRVANEVNSAILRSQVQEPGTW